LETLCLFDGQGQAKVFPAFCLVVPVSMRPLPTEIRVAFLDDK
jgi:hypothetical protein